MKGKTKLKITHGNEGDKIYIQKKTPQKGINKKKKDFLFFIFLAKKVNKAQEENPPKKTK